MYHLQFRGSMILDLKSTDFNPGHAGRLNVDLSVVGDTLRQFRSRAPLRQPPDRVANFHHHSEFGLRTRGIFRALTVG